MYGFKRMFFYTFFLLVLNAGAVVNIAAAQTKLDLNDVSWLWPAPNTKEEMANIIAVVDLNSSISVKTGSMGGTGGLPFSIDCGSDSVLAGLGGRSGKLIDQIHALCVRVDVNGNWIGSPAITGESKGGGGGLPFLQQCGTNQAVVGFTGSNENGMSASLQTHCRQLADNNSATRDLITLEATGGVSAIKSSLMCAENTVARGIFGASASLLDSLGLNCVDSQPVWLDKHFQDLLTAIDGGLTTVEGNQVQFGPEIRNKSVWMVAGMRVDPCAPGCSAQVVPSFNNQKTQIRLIVQPVTDGVVVHDVAVHLVYSWVDGTNRDDEKFREILVDLDELKIMSAGIGAPTAGKALGVHPGLHTDDASFHVSVRSFLQKHLSADRLDSIALMGIQSGIEPWFFLALTRLPTDSFGGIPFPIPSAEPQMIDFRSGGRVAPTPVVTNRPLGGVSTAVMFKRPFSDLNAFAVVGKNDAGSEVLDNELRNRDIPDLIANPLHSHFFNTDCVSCHTETRRRLRFNLPVGDFAFKPEGHPPAVAEGLLPKDDWNVRNFGWFTPHAIIGGGPAVPVVTQRSANESQEVVEFIERNFRAESLQ